MKGKCSRSSPLLLPASCLCCSPPLLLPLPLLLGAAAVFPLFVVVVIRAFHYRPVVPFSGAIKNPITGLSTLSRIPAIMTANACLTRSYSAASRTVFPLRAAARHCPRLHYRGPRHNFRHSTLSRIPAIITANARLIRSYSASVTPSSIACCYSCQYRRRHQHHLYHRLLPHPPYVVIARIILEGKQLLSAGYQY